MDIEQPFVPESISAIKNTVMEGVFNTCKLILGGNITNVAGVFTELGIGFGIIVFAVMTFTTVYSLWFLTIAARKTESKGLVEIGEKLDDKKGKLFVTLTLLLMCIVPLIFFIIKSSLYINLALQFYGVNVNEQIVQLGVGIVCLIMSLCFQNGKHLKYVSIVGLASLSFTSLYTIYLLVANFSSIDFAAQQMFKLNNKSIEKISIVCFALCSHYGILSVTNNFKSLKECKTTIIAGNMISLAVYLITGICGHLVQTQYNTDDFFLSIPKNVFTETLKLTLAVVNISTFPLVMIAAREALDSLVSKRIKTNHRKATTYTEIVSLAVLCYVVSILFNAYQNMLAAMFFFTGSIIMFALPSYFYYRVMEKKLTLFSKFILALDGILTLFGFFAGVYVLIP